MPSQTPWENYDMYEGPGVPWNPDEVQDPGAQRQREGDRASVRGGLR